MAFRNRLTRRVLFTGAATAVAVGASVGIALAVAITFTISPGGAITAKAGTTTLTDTNTGSVLTCASSSSTGTLKKGSGISGANLGSITKLSFSKCTGPLGLTFTVANSGFPWTLSGTSYNAGTGTTTGFINHIKSKLTGPSCTANVAGATATSVRPGQGHLQEQHRQAHGARRRRESARLERRRLRRPDQHRRRYSVRRCLHGDTEADHQVPVTSTTGR